MQQTSKTSVTVRAEGPQQFPRNVLFFVCEKERTFLVDEGRRRIDMTATPSLEISRGSLTRILINTSIKTYKA